MSIKWAFRALITIQFSLNVPIFNVCLYSKRNLHVHIKHNLQHFLHKIPIFQSAKLNIILTLYAF